MQDIEQFDISLNYFLPTIIQPRANLSCLAFCDWDGYGKKTVIAFKVL